MKPQQSQSLSLSQSYAPQYSVSPVKANLLGKKGILQSIGQQSLNRNIGVKSLDQDSGYFPKSTLPVGKSPQSSTGLYSSSTFDGQDLKTARSVCVLSLDELQSMKDRARLADSVGMTDRYVEKKRLHELSMKRVENWPDSLLSITSKKEKERFERFEKIEKEKRIIDEQEEALRQLKYRMMIKEANQKIFEQDARVRQFKKKILFVEVAEERKEQMELMKEKQEMYKQIEADRLAESLNNRQNEEQEEKRKLQKRNQDVRELKATLKDQVHEAKKKRYEEYVNYNTEGQLVKEKAIQEETENQQKKLNNKAKAKKYLNDVEEQKRQVKAMKDEADRMQQEEDAREKEEERRKAQLLEMRKQRETMKIREMINIRDKMHASQLKEKNAKVDNEEARIQQQVNQQRMKEDKIAEEKQLDLKRKKEQMKQSIQESIELKARLEAERKQKEKDLAESLLKQSRIIEHDDQQEKIFQLKRKYDIRNQQLAQIDEKKRLVEERLMNELNEDEKLRNSIEVDRRIFKTWADSQIDEMKSPGRQLQPLVKELAAIQQAN